MRHILLLIFMICHLFVKAQTAQSDFEISDSMYATLIKEAKPAHRQHVTLDEKLALLHNVFKDDFIKFKHEFSRIVTSLESQLLNEEPANIIRISAALGCFHFKMLDIKAKDNYNKVLQLASKLITPEATYYQELSEAYASLSLIALFENHIDSSLIMLDRLKGIVKPDDTSSLFKMYSNYDEVYTILGQYQQALEYEHLCLNLMTTDNFQYNRIVLYYLQIAGTHVYLFHETGDKIYADSARYYIDKILTDKPAVVAQWTSECSYCIGKLLFFEGNLKEAILMFDKFDSTRKDVNEQYIFGSKNNNDVYRLLAKLRLGDEQAIYQLENDFIPRRTTKLKIFVLSELYQFWARKKNWQKAYHYLDSYKIYSDSIDAENNKYKLFEINQKYKSAEKESEIHVLELDKLKRSRLLWLLSSILLLSVAGTGIYIRYSKLKTRQKDANNELNRQMLINKLNDAERMHSEKIELLNIQKEAVIQKQKLDISRNMHDEIGNGIAALRYYIADLKHSQSDGKMQSLLASIEDEAKTLYMHTRHFMNDLSDSSFKNPKDISSFIESLELKFPKEGNFNIDIIADKTQIDKNLAGKFQSELYYILREAVINCIKHAQASKLIIEIAFKEDLCYFSVRDNGIGISQTHAANGMGLNNIQARVRSLDGEVEVAAGIKGTVVQGSFPYKIEMQ